MAKQTQALRRAEIPSVAARRSAAPDALDDLALAQRRGRPSKFGRAARAVTVTLPEDVIDGLAAINLDISRAIVQLAETRAPRRILPSPVEVSEYGDGALIVVSPFAALKKLRGVELIPLSDGRALITLGSAQTVSDLELGLRDALDESHSAADRKALEGIVTILQRARQSPNAAVRTRTIIVVDPSKRGRKSTAKRER